MEKNIIINGIFYSNKLTGIERFAHEITSRLDTCSSSGELTLVLPPDTPENIPDFRNISVVRLWKTPGKPLKNLKLALYILLHHSYCIDYGNNTPILGHGLVFLHDIYCRVFPDDFRTAEDRKTMKKTCRMYERIARNADTICTVSEFSKQQIMQYYNVPDEKIHVIYSGSNHMAAISPDESIFEKFPELKAHPFYFTLGSLSLRKNLKWIADHAALNPDELFVISGTALKNVVPPELEKLRTLKNVICAGYLSDEEVKALMQKCKAFVFPSYFEGFGLPPLEALACGAQIIISNAASLPEIYGNCAHYIDPFNPDIDLDRLLAEPVDSSAPLFEKYSLDRSAVQLYELLKKI
jgi:glycosyltransferase involved in cell wall biosynthesis